MPQKPHHKYHYVSDPAQANRALVLFDVAPTRVEIHALVAWSHPFGSGSIVAGQQLGSGSIVAGQQLGWAIVVFFSLMGHPLILGVRTKQLASARRFQARLLQPSRRDVLLRNATVVQQITTE